MSEEPVDTRPGWDYEDALEQDERFERRLPLKEFFVLLLVLAVVAIRLFLG